MMTAHRDDTDVVYTVEEAAHLLRLGRNQTYAAIRRGEIPAKRVGRKYLIYKPALDAWLRENSGRAGPDPPQS